MNQGSLSRVVFPLWGALLGGLCWYRGIVNGTILTPLFRLGMTGFMRDHRTLPSFHGETSSSWGEDSELGEDCEPFRDG